MAPMKFFSQLSLLAFVVSCTTISTFDLEQNVLTTQMQTPETSGKLGAGKLEIMAGVIQEVNHTKTTQENVSTGSSAGNVSIIETVDIEGELEGGVNLGLGTLESLDLNFTLIGSGFGLYGVQWQFLGDSRKNISNGYKGSFSLHYGKNRQKNLKSSESGGFFQKADRFETVTGNTYQKAYVAQLNFGERKSDSTLWYLNNLFGYYLLEADMTVSGTDQYLYGKKGWQHGLLLGLKYTNKQNKWFSSKLEVGVSTLKFSGERSSHLFLINTAMGFFWL